MRKSTAPQTRDLLVLSTDGEYKITIPAEAKVTFGPAFPVSREQKGWSNPPGAREYALRIYVDKKENLIAVFTGVRQFREFSIQVAKKVTAEAGKTLWKSDESGYEVTTSAKRDSKFVDVKQLMEGSDPDGF